MSNNVLKEFQAELRMQLPNIDTKQEWTFEVTSGKITKKNMVDKDKKVVLVSQRNLNAFAETKTIPADLLATYGLLLAGLEPTSKVPDNLEKK